MENNRTKLYQKLFNIQQGLKAPKTLENKFGGFKYRNSEQILRELKPLCKQNNCILITPQTVQLIGSRYYIYTTAVLIDIETGESIEAAGPAREAETKTGMDASQITGSSDSYSKKYALGNLFMIDDGIDADSMDNTKEKEKDPIQEQEDQLNAAIAEVAICNTVEELKDVYNRYPKLQKMRRLVDAIRIRKSAIEMAE